MKRDVIVQFGSFRLTLSYEEDDLFPQADSGMRPLFLDQFEQALADKMDIELHILEAITKLGLGFSLIFGIWVEKLAEVQKESLSYMDKVEQGIDPAEMLRAYLQKIHEDLDLTGVSLDRDSPFNAEIDALDLPDDDVLLG